MKFVMAFCTGVLVLCSGCSPLHQVQYGEANRWLPGARQRLLGKEAVVTTRSGQSVAGTIVVLDSAWITVRPADSGMTWHRPLADIESIQKPKKTWGVVGGILGGAFLGGFVGEAYAIGGIVGGIMMAMATLSDLYEFVPPAVPVTAIDSTKKPTTDQSGGDR